MAPKRNLNFGNLSPQPAVSTKGVVGKRTSKKSAGPFTPEDGPKIAKAVLYLGPRYTRKRGELPLSSHLMFSRLKVLLGFQHHPESIMRYFKRWRLGNEKGWEAMKEEAEVSGQTYFDELAQHEEILIQSGDLEDDRMKIEGGDDESEGDEHSVGATMGREHSEEPLPSRRRASQRNKNAGQFTAQDKLNIARAVIYLGPRYTRREGRKRSNTELPVGSKLLFRRMKTMLSYNHNYESIKRCFKRWRRENMAEWEAMKEEAEANGEGYFDEWSKLEEELIARGVLDDNRIGTENGDDISNGDDLSVGGSDQQLEDHEPSEQSFPPQEEAEVGDGQTAYIYFQTDQSGAQQEDDEEGEHYMDYVVEEANSDQDDVGEEGRDQPGAHEDGNAPQIVHNQYHFHGPVMFVPGWIPPQ